MTTESADRTSPPRRRWTNHAPPDHDRRRSHEGEHPGCQHVRHNRQAGLAVHVLGDWARGPRLDEEAVGPHVALLDLPDAVPEAAEAGQHAEC
jgi:hypothetical protein